MGAQLRELPHRLEPKVLLFAEELLADVKAGKVVGLMILKQDSKGTTYQSAGLKHRFEILGYLSHAMDKLQRDDPL